MSQIKRDPDAPPAPPTGGAYKDYILRSAPPPSLSHQKYNLMKFSTLGQRTINPTTFERPIRLNRKDPRLVRKLNDEDIERTNRAALPPGTEEVKLNQEEVKEKVREEMDMSLVGTGTSGLAPAIRTKGNMFKKKTKRVFVSSEEARRLKREEWMPWVLEDVEGQERWIGRLEGGTGESTSSGVGGGGVSTAAKRATMEANKKGTGMQGWRPPPLAGDAGTGGSSYVAFVFEKDGQDFTVFPTSRFYKFNKGPNYLTLGTDEAEDLYNKQQKSSEVDRWMMQKRLPIAGVTPLPSSTSHNIKRPNTPVLPGSNGIRSRLLDNIASNQARQQSLPVDSKFRTVVSAQAAGQSDSRRRESGRGEQSEDEFDFEEDFQDDEEGIARVDDLADEEAVKELEGRMRKEMRGANGVVRGEEQEEAEEREGRRGKELGVGGKETKKLVRKIERGGRRSESDEDREVNPYASDEDNSSDSGDENNDGNVSSASQPTAKLSTQTTRLKNSHSRTGSSSRTGSPGPSAAFVAKRATSPTGSRTRGTSPGGSRANSPGASPGGGGGKRKRDGSELSPDEKRKKSSTSNTISLPDSPSSTSSATEPLITESDIIALLKTKPSFQTKDVLTHFRRQLKGNRENKRLIGGMLMGVASLVEGNLVLKSGY